MALQSRIRIARSSTISRIQSEFLAAVTPTANLDCTLPEAIIILVSHMTIPFSGLDLNLLRVFDAVMQERSVLRAGRRMCLSQSAVSHALARLREVLDDELFTRTSAGMQPTARALTMAPLIRAAWKSLEAAIAEPRFEPASSTRRFTIAVNDFVTAVMVPRLLGLLGGEAPLVDLVVCSDSRLDLTEQLDLGQVDAAIGTFSNIASRFRLTSLFTYDDVLIASSSRQLGKLSLDDLSGLSIAAISLHGDHQRIVDGYVLERSLSRRSEMYDRSALERAVSDLKGSPRIAIALPHALALPSLLEDGRLTAIVPRPLAMSLARTHPLSTHDLPYKTALVDVGLLWHERNAGDPGHQWLREMLGRAADPLRARLFELMEPSRSISVGSRSRMTERA
jgi:DNA-binding transcriptional LysR family regulator